MKSQTTKAETYGLIYEVIEYILQKKKWHETALYGSVNIIVLQYIGRSVRSSTAYVLQIPTTPTPPIIPNRREMREVPW